MAVEIVVIALFHGVFEKAVFEILFKLGQAFVDVVFHRVHKSLAFADDDIVCKVCFKELGGEKAVFTAVVKEFCLVGVREESFRDGHAVLVGIVIVVFFFNGRSFGARVKVFFHIA